MSASDEFAAALGGEVGGHVTRSPDFSGWEWWCTDCDAGGDSSTEHAAALTLYRHRRATHWKTHEAGSVL